MAKGFKHGTSNPLNFKVVDYATEDELNADTPRENTIGVITTTPMTSWLFSATEPKEPEAGMVWLSVGTSSPVEFNALKGKTLQVYPSQAKQYADGKFETVPTMSYQNGEWVSWIPVGALYYKGHECEHNGGIWINKPWAAGSNGYEGVAATSFIKKDDQIILELINAGAGKSTTLIKKDPVDLTNYSTLTFYGVISGLKYFYVFAAKEGTTYFSDASARAMASIFGVDSEIVVDIEKLTGKCIVGIGVAQNDKSQTSKIILKGMMLS